MDLRLGAPFFMAKSKDKTPRSLVVELPPKPVHTGRKKPVPRIVVEISEGGASLVRCPHQDIDIEIHDYDVPEDWEGGEEVGSPEPNVTSSIKTDLFGRRYQCIKFTRRLKKKS